MLLSIPRSGNTFMRYIMEYLSGYPSAYLYNASELDMDLPLINRNSNSPYMIYKTHGYPDGRGDLFLRELVNMPGASCGDEGAHTFAFILLLRNPLELEGRENTDIKDVWKQWFGCNPAPPMGTIVPSTEWQHSHIFHSNMRFFTYFKGEKKIFYYEDMVETPDIYVQEVAQFLGIEDMSKVKNFMLDYTMHKQTCMNIYVKQQPGQSKTNGNEGVVHSLRYTAGERNAFWQKVAEEFPAYGDIVKKYSK